MATRIADEKKRYEEKLTHSLDVMKLKHEAEIARFRAKVESHTKEVVNLNNTLDRMAEESERAYCSCSSIAGSN